MTNVHPAVGNRSGRQACSASTPAGNLNATTMSCLEAYQQLGVASQSDLVVNCFSPAVTNTIRLWSNISFCPSYSPSIQSPLHFDCHALTSSHVNPRAQTYNKTASSIFLIELLLTGVYLISHANNHHASSGPSTLNDNGN
ncbi:hypothetical protein N7501_000984 [Penicillium viridicatum]|nr:hypothetical protein N7501_000984 [Penicillium viridicatum]